METSSNCHCVPISVDNLAQLLEKEWLLTNSRGSYASSTVIGCNTRRYHGLLVASLHPPVERIVALSDMFETVKLADKTYELANFEFSDRIHPQGYRFLRKFRRDTGVHFLYELDGPEGSGGLEGLEIEKSIYLVHDQDLVIISYEFSGARQGLELSGGRQGLKFSLMPLVALRDFHSLQSSAISLKVECDNGVVTTGTIDPNGPAVHLYCPGSTFNRGADWWYSMRYRQESARGQHDYEDVWAPGVFQMEIDCPGKIFMVATATAGLERPGPLDGDIEGIIHSLNERRHKLLSLADAKDKHEADLTCAADNFIVRRQIGDSAHSASILAGFHWFADWGRDTFISLPGLLLCTGRFDEAHEVLTTFATALNQGQIPNRFDDYGGPAHYNSVDASLWFINAAYQYLLATDDKCGFQKEFYPVIAAIIEAYRTGTRDNIHADSDGLIIAGDVSTQLTWMDAKCNGVAFTPRYGKAVEINALWINALCIMGQTADDAQQRQEYLSQGKLAELNFCKLFWNAQNNCLNDCILPDGSVDAAIRPNQILAVSLPFSCLEPKKQAAVVDVVSKQLLTPYGLRTLSPLDSRYHSHYNGDQFQRDSAYHQGTVWAFLMGHFIEAYLKVNNFSQAARQQGLEYIEPLLRHLTEDACIGSISEIFDGDYPHRPKGCIAQAWSVAELLRCYKMLRK